MNDDVGPLDQRYFEWLYSHVGSLSNRNPVRSHWLLCERLFKTPFDGWQPNDDNRAEDGKELRFEFLDESGLPFDKDWMELDCSYFEMLIALARRAAFQSFDTHWTDFWWFWKFMENLELRKYNDDRWNNGVSDAVDLVLDMVNRRAYESNGRGGLFPLRDPHKDQREVELWMQLSAYLLENVSELADV